MAQTIGKRKMLLMGAAPAVALTAFLVLAMPGFAFMGAQIQSQTSTPADVITPHGYVTVSVTRDGQEIYHNEQHNLITNAGKDFIAAQIGSNATSGNGANYIALTADTGAPAATDTTLAGEITNNGLQRAQGTYSHVTGAQTFKVAKTFQATGTVNNVLKAGLFTASSGGTMVAENTFTGVTLANGDQLTITWTITLT